MRKSDKRLAYLLVSAIVAILIVLIFVPIAVTFYYSLCDYKLTSRKGIQFAGLKNYLDVLADETTQVALVNSGIIFVIVLAITVVLGMIFALALTKKQRSPASFWRWWSFRGRCLRLSTVLSGGSCFTQASALSTVFCCT